MLKPNHSKPIAFSKPTSTTTTKPPSIEPSTEEAFPHTSAIEILGVGVTERRERFLKVQVGERSDLLNLDSLAHSGSEEWTRLSRLDEPLITRAARTEFIGRVQDEGRKPPTFNVATKTGWRDGVFVLPPGLAPRGQPDVEVYFDPRYDPYHDRLTRVGTAQGWLELAGLCSGKTRLMAALCLAFTGPVCAAFGFEPPGLQFVSVGGKGKTTIGRVAATVWGGDTSVERRLGCGTSWNHTANNLEIVAAAFNQMLLFLDDMHKAKREAVEAIISIMNGEGRGRLTETSPVSFCTPVLSTSNTSVIAIAKELKLQKWFEALIDRVADLPLPDGCPYFFEGVRTPDELETYGDRLRELSRQHFGLAGPAFVRFLAKAMTADRAGLQAYVETRRRTYRDASKDIMSRRERDLTRIGGRYATKYIAGCLAIRFSILPFSEGELREALLTCQRDHVAFIDQELPVTGGRGRNGPGSLPAANLLTVSTQTPLDRLKTFVEENRKDGFVDIRKRGATSSPVASDVGYIGEHDGKEEYWIPGKRFLAIAGSAGEAADLKKELFDLGLLETDKRGEGLSYVVKRRVPGRARMNFVVLRAKAKTTQQARPTLRKTP